MKGCLGLLGRVRGAEPIPQLLDRRGETGQEATGRLGVAWFGLLSIGTYLRARLDRRRAPKTTLRGSRLASGLRQAAVARLGEAWEAGAALVRARYRIPPAKGLPAQRNERPSDLPMRWRWERRDRRFRDPPAGRGKTQMRQSVTRARDPLPAQLRFSVLQRDGFRCRYCGRTSREPSVALHVDHVVPLAAGGATTEDNLLTACEECNLGKATRAVVSVGS